VIRLLARADDALAAFAQRRSARALRDALAAVVEVRVGQRPFLPQAVRGRFPLVDVRADGVGIGALGTAAATATLRNVRVPPRQLLTGRVRVIAAEWVAVRIVLPYEQLARASRVPGLSLRFEREALSAGVSVSVPGFGNVVEVRGRADLTVDRAGSVRLAVRDLALADAVTGIPVPLPALRSLLPALDTPVPLPPLPYRLRIDRVVPTPGGLAVLASAPATTTFRIRGER
jgi:hypothetical protein